MSPPSPASLLVDLSAVAANFAALQAEAAGAEIAPVVKADCYGLGAERIPARLWAEGARTFFVARTAEGEALRRSLGSERPAAIYVLDGVAPGRAPRLVGADLRPVLNAPEEADAWRALGEGRPCAVHVDTGLNRLGFRPEDAATLAADLRGLNVDLIMSHLACASEPAHPLNAAQARIFAEMRPLFPQARASLANSAGAFSGPDYRYDLLRPGISLYGGGPYETRDGRVAAVASLTAPILQVRDVHAGETVGYGASFTAERDLTVAIAGIGYADGVLRSAFPNGSVWLDGARRRLLGRVSMDLIALDATGAEALAGDRVQLFGPDLPIDEAAAAWGTIAYELITRIGPRVERVWVD